jgi:hypothetical protein
MENLIMSKEIVKNVLGELIECVKELSVATLKDNGNTSEDCQLHGLLNALKQADSLVCGIEDVDVRVLSKTDLAVTDIEKGYLFENHEMNVSAVSEKAEEMVKKSLYARTDLANMIHKLKNA